ncbi:aldose 1-epimerase family protein [Salinibacterium sp. NSLL150]|uniref:aldose 1-epimerase family protein n=1 Tax=unclassified Salinibacterium TaxID=2632331 RepID=UPI0018CCC57D|nr:MULTISPECIES: aldose 1-epimerase family protein [unclassified Salinibacterium]MBH0097595.1 aldose 1-epimerase family protein [Salinibacterium sp. NSLL35]MBH0100350.1 aldose 1-epimerase family protein [Salinibacterium sp. NSLL150]MBH0103109.1 aldose 1-epimerase family protein [Salinibacterium sp. NSLL16]MBH0105870.1 aldose 1-epimerase family protein [Salinibacterium sp. NSLL17]
MSNVFGRETTALRERIGSLSQVVRLDSFVEAEGPARGARRLRMVNGSGIEIELHPDRALDIGQVTFEGIPIAWISPTEITSPEAFEPEGAGWLRTFGGGLLATCGLDTFGPAGEDAGQTLGLHGRIGAQKARVIRAEANDREVVVEAVTRQAAVFGENLTLHRVISAEVGANSFLLEDIVTNESFAEQPHMILYHINLGWPLLSESTIVDIPTRETVARDAEGEKGIDAWQTGAAPTPGFAEQVFRHTIGDQPSAQVRVSNPDLGVELIVEFSGLELPWLFQWKMVGQGHYALGIEPTNTPNVFGRSAARAAGELGSIPAGESVRYSVRFTLQRINESDGVRDEGSSV